MYPKFIIVTQPGEYEGTLRMGECINHRDLVIGYEKVHGGGWYLREDERKSITLYGSSGDFGSPRLKFLNRIERRFRDYIFWYTPFIGCPPNPIDTSEVEWI